MLLYIAQSLKTFLGSKNITASSFSTNSPKAHGLFTLTSKKFYSLGSMIALSFIARSQTQKQIANKTRYILIEIRFAKLLKHMKTHCNPTNSSTQRSGKRAKETQTLETVEFMKERSH